MSIETSVPRHSPLVVVGASAGGVEALSGFVAGLPADLRATVLVVLHMSADSPSALATILRRRSALPVRQATDGELLVAGQVLVARPDHHLVVGGDRVILTHGPKENGHRPAVDVLFRSAARSAGPRAFAVVLSGALDDGAAGALSVHGGGGAVAVQDFEEALYPSMPQSAAAAVDSARRGTVAELASLVAAWVADLPEADPHLEDELTELEMEVEMARMDPVAVHDPDRPGTPAGFGCPDCGGSLYRIEEGDLVRFRCRVGHAWSPESLLARQSVELEGALWIALRSLEEKAALNAELGERAQTIGHDRTAARFAKNADEVSDAAELVRRLIVQLGEAAAGQQSTGPSADA
ncbi:chemotaxis protein CheB [Aeromicrobium sp. 179-A 4D2 NHS]|uniref:chemotaxis protein CheB n=1 Tax=Aeromicrobium sp. 179-A 4D2 NHS TaxID=3142375 RepID=UPI0039A02444